MKVSLGKYSGMKICVAVSGGKDSMALLHYIYVHGAEYGISLSALNCDHGIRKDSSARDSAFVKGWCRSHNIPLLTFAENCVALSRENCVSVETAARNWRHRCYYCATVNNYAEGWEGVDAVATAHQLDDNAETVLFNLARGTALSGACGITDCVMRLTDGNLSEEVKLIRPLINVTRAEIEAYIGINGIEYVEDETNNTDDYTRNRIRRYVIPELEKAVPGAAKSLFRFSRLAAEDEEYFQDKISKLVFADGCGGVLIKTCKERVLFSRAAVKAVKGIFDKKDYTRDIVDGLYALQFSDVGKKFNFLGLTAYKEEGQIAICENRAEELKETSFRAGGFPDYGITISGNPPADICRGKVLRFDKAKIPEGAVIRLRECGDVFTKFGGGTKSLGDFMTDRKIPLRFRDKLPVIAYGKEILAVCGVEISDKIKITEDTSAVGYIYVTGGGE